MHYLLAVLYFNTIKPPPRTTLKPRKGRGFLQNGQTLQAMTHPYCVLDLIAMRFGSIISIINQGNKMLEKIIKKVAVYEYVDGGEMSCMAGVQFVTDYNRTDADTMRVSEWMDVEFTKRIESNIQERLDLINISTTKCYDELSLIGSKLTELRKQRKELNLLSGEVL